MERIAPERASERESQRPHRLTADVTAECRKTEAASPETPGGGHSRHVLVRVERRFGGEDKDDVSGPRTCVHGWRVLGEVGREVWGGGSATGVVQLSGAVQREALHGWKNRSGRSTHLVYSSKSTK